MGGAEEAAAGRLAWCATSTALARARRPPPRAQSVTQTGLGPGWGGKLVTLLDRRVSLEGQKCCAVLCCAVVRIGQSLNR